MLNESNFVIASPDGDETLIHVTNYNSETGELEIFTITNEDYLDYRLVMTMKKVEG